MNINLITDGIIFGDKTLSEEGREEIVFEIMNIYDRIDNPKSNLTLMHLVPMNDKALVHSLISAYEFFAVKHFIECGRNPATCYKDI